MGWVLGYPHMSSAFVESLSSIVCKTQQIKCLSSMRTQMKKKMVCDNDNNQSCNNESTMKIIKSEE